MKAHYKSPSDTTSEVEIQVLIFTLAIYSLTLTHTTTNSWRLGESYHHFSVHLPADPPPNSPAETLGSRLLPPLDAPLLSVTSSDASPSIRPPRQLPRRLLLRLRMRRRRLMITVEKARSGRCARSSVLLSM